MKPPFEFINHTADYAMRAWGPDFRALVENAARGLIRLLADVDGLQLSEHTELQVEGDSREAVLVHALKELLLLEEDGRLPVSVEVLSADAVCAHLRVGLVDLDSAADRLESAVKAVTYHDLEIIEDAAGLSVEVVLDT